MHKKSKVLVPTTLIIGCGYIGSRLAKELLERGHLVYGLRRNVTHLPQGVKPIVADLTTDELGGWPDHIDYVVYSAAANSRTEDDYRTVYTDGLGRVLKRISTYSQKPRRIFFTSSTAVYHQNEGEWVDEYSETSPESFNGQIMLAAEKLLTDSVLPSTVVRFGGIYGPDRTYMLDRVRAGETYESGSLVYGNRIHADDCAGILSYLIQRDLDGQSVDPLYLGVDSSPAPLSEMSLWLSQQLGLQPHSTVPTPQRGGNKRCSNQRIRDAGYQFRYPSYKEGYRQMLG